MILKPATGIGDEFDQGRIGRACHPLDLADDQPDLLTAAERASLDVDFQRPIGGGGEVQSFVHVSKPAGQEGPVENNHQSPLANDHASNHASNRLEGRSPIEARCIGETTSPSSLKICGRRCRTASPVRAGASGAWAQALPRLLHGAATGLLIVIAVWEWGSFHGGWVERFARFREAKLKNRNPTPL